MEMGAVYIGFLFCIDGIKKGKHNLYIYILGLIGVIIIWGHGQQILYPDKSIYYDL